MKITDEFADIALCTWRRAVAGSAFATGGRTAGHGGESKGYRVASMSEQELLDIFDARANMEAMLVSLAIARGGDEWEADVLAKAHLLSKLEACDASEKMLDEWDLRHQAFHTAIVAGCGSYYLLQMRERLFDLAARYRFIWLRRTVLSVEMLEDKHDQHQTLTAAVLARRYRARQ